MKFGKNFATIVLMSISLAACSAPQARLVDRQSGVVGLGRVENTAFGNSGPMKISFPSEDYVGTWVTVRDSSYAASGGRGTATLTSNKGNRLVCEFRYSSVTLTGVGTCQRQDKSVYDLQVI